MNELFGIDMTTLTTILVGLLAICLLGVAWIAWRRRVVFNLGVRTLPRRKAQTLLIVTGLMLSTLIITSALGVGDTVDHSITSEVYDSLRTVDMLVVDDSHADSTFGVFDGSIDAGTLPIVESALAGNDDVDGIIPVLTEPVAATHEASGQAEPRVVAVGLDPAKLEGFGGLTTIDGDSLDLAGLPAQSVAVNETLANLLLADAGSTLEIFVNNQPFEVTVGAVVEDSLLSGAGVYDDQGSGDIGGLVMPLTELQALTGNVSSYSAIALSATGDDHAGVALTESVTSAVAPSLEGTGAAVNPLKSELLHEAESAGQVFAGLFLVVGLFSVAAGILLILLIFTMLAAERRSEMGMARAVGAQRRQLIQQFVSEGAAYSLLAGVLGSALGVAAAIGIGLGLSWVFGDFIDVEPYVSARSVVAAYALGVVITFIAVVGSSWRISRLNVVAAVRDLPDTARRKRSWRALIWPVVMVLLGALLTSSGVSSGSAMPFMTGVSLLILSGALLLRAAGVSGRLVLSAASLLLLVFWLMPAKQFEQLFGEYDGDFEMFFVSGIFLVVAATLLMMQNDSWLLSIVNRVGSFFGTRRTAFTLAVAYPGSARSRTGMTAAMFSLIVFSLVTIATINLNFSNAFLGDAATAGWDVRGTTLSSSPPSDVVSELDAAGFDTNQISAAGAVALPSLDTVQSRIAGSSDWREASIGGMDADFISATDWKFITRAAGYDSDEQVINMLLKEPNVAVVPSWYVEGEEGMGGEEDSLFLDIDLKVDTFQPIVVQFLGSDGLPHDVTIIGVIDPQLSSLDSILASESTVGAIYLQTEATTYFFSVADKDASESVAREIESSLLPYGVQTVSIRELLEDDMRENNGFFLILQAFMALGMLVGVAAIGVIASRNVVERRQQIGVLRALGFQRGHVSLSFLIEAAFVVAMGVVSGTLLGLALARNLLTSGEIAEAGSIDFTAPWGTIAVVLSLAVGAAMLTTWLPARQAARIAPAEALRYE